VLITSTEEEDYAAIRPSLRSILLEQAAEFQASNAARFGINLPAGGYTINDLFASFVADMDVANFASNYATVNVPFSLASPTRALQQLPRPRLHLPARCTGPPRGFSLRLDYAYKYLGILGVTNFFSFTLGW
jgi:hypothetical protein